MKTFAIIEDEKGEKRVVPSKWLTDSNKSLWWPPINDIFKIRKLVTNLSDIQNDWEKYPVNRLIKTKDNYNEAVQAMKTGLAELTDESDLEALRKSRSKRNKRRNSDNGSDCERKKSKESQLISEQSSDTEISEDETSSTQPQLIVPTVPSTLNVIDQNKTLRESQNTKQDENINPDKVEEIKSLMSLQKKILVNTNRIIYMQNSIESRLVNLENNQNSSAVISPAVTELMSKYFPINGNERKMDDVENRLKNKSFFNNLISYMSGRGGDSCRDIVYRILDTIIINDELMKYTFYGTNSKLAFSKLAICSCIFHAVKTRFQNSTDEEIRLNLSARIDTAATRVKRARSMSKNPRRQTFVPILVEEEDRLSDNDQSQ